MFAASQFGGFSTGGENGERGYTLTFVIAYIRQVSHSPSLHCKTVLIFKGTLARDFRPLFSSSNNSA
jgi:hypothetical protein